MTVGQRILRALVVLRALIGPNGDLGGIIR